MKTLQLTDEQLGTVMLVLSIYREQLDDIVSAVEDAQMDDEPFVTWRYVDEPEDEA